MLEGIFEAFVKASPISIMMRGRMEYIFRPQRLEVIFETYAKLQYGRELLFSSLVESVRDFQTNNQSNSDAV